ncbi:MAG: hypothetical protein LLG20_18270 [Acidobacteriales bacterium]|nr:hypothetical protein [Terriglobales bacterium]
MNFFLNFLTALAWIWGVLLLVSFCLNAGHVSDTVMDEFEPKSGPWSSQCRATDSGRKASLLVTLWSDPRGMVLTIDGRPKHGIHAQAKIEFPASALLLSLDDFGARYLQPAIHALANQIGFVHTLPDFDALGVA